MAGNIKHVLVRDGRYYAWLVVSKNLRPYMNNKSELRTPLGPDRRAALRAHPMAVADLMHQITQAERRKSEALGVAVAPGRYPLTDAQIALRSYRDRLAQDEAARNQNAHYAQVGIDDGYLHNLREGIAGRLGDAALIELVGHRIEHFRNLGNTAATTGSSEWRALARAVCISEYEALERLTERDEGSYAGEPKHALLRGADPVADDFQRYHFRVSLETTMPHANWAAQVSKLNVDGNRFLNRSVSICAMMMRGASLRLI